MPVRVAIWDPLPSFRHGIMTVLERDELYPGKPEDLLAWATEQPRTVIFITLQSKQDWSLLRELRSARSDLTLIALLAEASVKAYVSAIEQGASAALARDAPLEAVVQVFDAAMKGLSVLPAEVVQALTTTQVPHRQPGQLTSRELEWLRALAAGVTIAELAESAGYSERAMYRLLRSLYARMNVANRTQAILKANRGGWL